MVLWAGAWPHDMEINQNLALLSKLPIYIVIGENDQYLGDEGIDKYLAVFDEFDIPYTLLTFKGDHRLDKEMLLDLATRISG